MRTAATLALSMALLAGCSSAQPEAAGSGAPLPVLTETTQLVRDDGAGVQQFETVPDRPIVVSSYRKCPTSACESPVTTVSAVDLRGEPWTIAQSDESARFEIAGNDVLVSSSDGDSATYAIESPMPTVVDVLETPSVDLGGRSPNT